MAFATQSNIDMNGPGILGSDVSGLSRRKSKRIAIGTGLTLSSGILSNSLDLSGYVPYTGASGTLNLGANNLICNAFNTTADMVINAAAGTDVIFQSNGTETFRVKSGTQGINLSHSASYINWFGTANINYASAGNLRIGTTATNALGSLSLNNLTSTGVVQVNSIRDTAGLGLHYLTSIARDTNFDYFAMNASAFKFGHTLTLEWMPNISCLATADIRVARNAVGQLDIRGNAGLRVRNFVNSADAPLTAGAITASGSIRVSNDVADTLSVRSDIRMLEFLGNGATTNGVGIGGSGFRPGINLAATTAIYFTNDIPASPSDAILVRSGTGIVDIRANNGFRIRNLANSADAPLSCSSLVATSSNGVTAVSIIGVLSPVTGHPAITLRDDLGYGIGMNADKRIVWSASSGTQNLFSGAIDTSISRISAGVLGVGTGGAGSVAGSLQLTNLLVSGFVDVTGTVFANGSNGIRITNRVYLIPPSDGVLALLNNSLNNFDRLQLGGTTSSFPAIKRNGTAINIRLADDSADAALTCAGITVTGTVTAGRIVVSPNSAFSATGIQVSTNSGIYNTSDNGRVRVRANGVDVAGFRSDGLYLSMIEFNAIDGVRATCLSQASAGVLQVGTTANNALGSLQLARITLPVDSWSIGTASQDRLYFASGGGNYYKASTHWFRNTSDTTVLIISSTGGIDASGAVQETITQSTADPTITDIPAGKARRWYNSTSNEVRDWVNIGGTLRKSAAYT